ncbi:MAG: tetratricopeptide repeat protein [Cyclobacteriaceae bacterium]|nr:tetratricopeptide repeat protein [Cyclobacteriaceae bacterium]
MRKYSFYNIAALSILLLAVIYSPACAQRERRKGPPDSQPNDTRLREAEYFFTEGEKYFILEDYAKALRSFQRVIELNPENPTIHYKIAEILSKSNKDEDLQRAAISIETAIRLDKKNKYFYLLASNIFTAMNNFQKAEQVLEAMFKEVKGSEEHLYELAAIYQYDKKPDEAIKVYDKAENLMGINEVSSLQKQKIYLDQGKVSEAIEEGEKLLKAFPEDERYAMSFAEVLAQKGQEKKAIESLEKFIVNHQDAGISKILLAQLYRATAQEKKAREILLAAFQDNSIDVSSKVVVVSSYNDQIRQNKIKNVADSELESFTLGLFNQLRKNYFDDPNVHIVGGDLFLILKRNAEAEHEFLEAVQHGSATFEAWQNLLSLESSGNKFDSLIFHSEQALEIFPNQALLHYFNGYGHFRLNHFREAAYSLEQAKRLSTNNQEFVSDINSMLGDAYNGTKEYAKSDKAYEDVLSFNPNNDFVLNNYSYYLALRKENLEKAEKMAALATKLKPNSSSFLDTYAWVLYTREKYKEAKKVMERAMSQPNISSTLFEHYGDILFQLGDVDGAVSQWQKARALTSQHDLIDKKIANRRLY